MPKERKKILSVSPEVGGNNQQLYNSVEKTVVHCEYGVEEENQIRDRVLYFIRDKVLKRKLFREENLSLTKLQEIANIFDEPEALLLSPAGTRENANTVYAKRTCGLRGTERTFQGKCWKCDYIGHIAKDCRKSKNHTCEKFAEKRDILQCVAIPDIREVAPLADSHTVSLRMKAGGVVVVAESKMFETLTKKTLNLGKKIHSMCSQ